MHFKIVCPGRNVMFNIERLHYSLENQTHKDFEVVFVDDESNDGGADYWEELSAGDSRFSSVYNDERQTVIGSMIRGMDKISSDPQDVIVKVDADDSLARADSLEIVSNAYDSGDVWTTHGSLVTASGSNWADNMSGPFPQYVVDTNTYRQVGWRIAHLFTFKKFLWDSIDHDRSLKNSLGQYWKYSSDLAICFPIWEMAGNRSKFIKEGIYLYNDTLSTNDHVTNRAAQVDNEKLIRSEQPYKTLEEVPE